LQLPRSHVGFQSEPKRVNSLIYFCKAFSSYFLDLFPFFFTPQRSVRVRVSLDKVIEGATQSANCFPRDRLVCAARVYCICSQQLYTSVSQAYINLLLSFTCCLSSSGWLYWDVSCLSGEGDMNIDDVIPPPSLPPQYVMLNRETTRRGVSRSVTIL
jgi:hypothetical protein